MSATAHLETGTLLLLLNEREFIRLGALVGLRARTTNKKETALVEDFIERDMPRRDKPRYFVSALPNLRPH